MKKKILLILIGAIIGMSGSIFAKDFTWWFPGNYSHQQENDKTPEVQIWCELRANRIGVETYCRWGGKYWILTCAGMERFFGEKIEPTEYGQYGCNDY